MALRRFYRSIPFWISLVLSQRVLAQEDSTRKILQWSGFVEAYAGITLGGSATLQDRPPFVYTYHRDRKVRVNLAMVKATFHHQRVRSTVGLMVGTYAQRNLSQEPAGWRQVWEAAVGLKLLAQREMWLDVGIFPSHIGFESAIGADCWTLTRSLLADNSPYYESGAKLTYASPNEKWLLAGLLLNGWQQIHRPQGPFVPAWGHQVQWKPTDRLTLNSSSFLGTASSERKGKYRLFHNFYGVWQVNPAWGLLVGLDAGWEQQAPQQNRFHTWMAPVGMIRFTPTPHWAITGRWEYFADPSQVVITLDQPADFRLSGISLNVDRHLGKRWLARIEGKYWQNTQAIFPASSGGGVSRRSQGMLTTAVSWRF